MSNLLQIKDLVAEGYQGEGWKRILNGVSLDVRRGEVLGLIGESGSGKSTLGLAAMGYAKQGCRFISGSVTFDGRDLLRADMEELRTIRGRRITYVAQSAAAAFNPAHRIIDQFAEVAVQHGTMNVSEARVRAKFLFRKLDLPFPDEIGRRYPHQVSGGQLQRCMVALALACNPDLIIFDEPTTALDVTTQVEFLHLVRETIQENSVAAIYISHDLAVVAQIAHKILVLLKGEVVETGSTEQIVNAPSAEYTRRLMLARKDITQNVRRDEFQIHGPLLQVENLRVSYGGVLAVSDMDLDIYPRETIAIIGESGSGKSTFARAIVGLLSSAEGKLVYRGEAISNSFQRRSNDLLRRIQMIYQSPETALNPRHTISKILSRPLSLYYRMNRVVREKRILELLQMVELNIDYATRFPRELSGGEKQRVCIARALAAEPDLIVCDEITSALDPLIAKDILVLLRNLQDSIGLSYLFITHDIGIAEAISHRIVVMREGRIIEQGFTTEVLSPPCQAYTQLLLDAVPQMDPTWLDRFSEGRIGAKPVAQQPIRAA